MNDLTSKLQFPDRSLFNPVTIVPIYVEPLAFSGERLFVGLVAQSAAGIEIFPLESLRRLKCVYGSAYKSLLAARDIALASLHEWILTHGVEDIGDWPSPGDGIFAGRPVHTTASSIFEAVRTSFTEFSSIYEEQSSLTELESTPRDDRMASLTFSRLEAAVRDIVSASRPALASKFSKKFQIKSNARSMTIGFVGNKLVVNFGLILPTELSTRVSNAKAKLWDLASAREGAKVGWFEYADNREFSLLVHQATERDVQYSMRQLNSVNEALAELEAEADKLELRCRAMSGPEEIAEHIMAVES